MKQKSKIFILGFFLSAGFFLIACGSSSNGTDNTTGGDAGGTGGSGSISIPDGYGVYGTVDDRTVQIKEANIGSALYVDGGNGDQVLDSNEILVFDFSSAEDKTEVFFVHRIEDALSFSANQTYTLTIPADEFVEIKFPDTDYQHKQITSAILYLTSWDTTYLGTMAGLLQITLADEAGTLTLKFNTFLDFIVQPNSNE